MAGKRQTSNEQDTRIAQLHREQRSGAAIHRVLEAEGLRSDPHPDITVRLVQQRVRELKDIEVSDTSGPWSALEADPEEARRVLDVAAYVVDVTDGRLWLTRELAGWASKVRQVSPNIPPAWAYALARAYRTLSQQPPELRDSRPHDAVLAAEPWQSEERAAWYRDLIIRTAQRDIEARAPAQRRAEWRRAELARRRGEKVSPGPIGVNLSSAPTGLWVDIAALLDPRPGGATGSICNPWPEISTPVSTPIPLDDSRQS